MKIIGICGGSGSGKSTVSAYLSSFGGLYLDADSIYHELIGQPSPCVSALAEAFGTEILEGDIVNRAKLRSLVFNDDEKRRLLNSISHRFVIEEIEKRISNAETQGYPFAVIDAPLLFESGLDDRCDLTVAVLADRNTRIARIVSRDGISKEDAAIRIEKQLSDDQLKERCDAIIHNDGDLNELKKHCEEIIELLSLSETEKE